MSLSFRICKIEMVQIPTLGGHSGEIVWRDNPRKTLGVYQAKRECPRLGHVILVIPSCWPAQSGTEAGFLPEGGQTPGAL